MEGSADRAARVYSTSTICSAAMLLESTAKHGGPCLRISPSLVGLLCCKLEYGKL
jgi:hypothetical protein